MDAGSHDGVARSEADAPAERGDVYDDVSERMRELGRIGGKRSGEKRRKRAEAPEAEAS